MLDTSSLVVGIAAVVILLFAGGAFFSKLQSRVLDYV